MGEAPVAVGEGGDFAGFDFAAAAPEDVGVGNRDSDFGEVLIDRGFVGEDEIFVRAVGDSHHVDVAKLGTAFAPVSVCEDVVTADFAAGFDFASGWNCPMKQGVKAGDAFAISERFDVFEESGETADDAAFVEVFGHFVKGFERDLRFGGAGGPDIGNEFLGSEFTLDGHEDAPFEFVELDDIHIHDFSESIGFAARFHAATADVTDAESEEAFGGHDAVMISANLVAEVIAVFGHRVTLRDFERGPKFVGGTGRSGIGRADDDVAGKGILLEHVVKGGVQFFDGKLPRDEGARSEVGGHERLPHAADRARAQHRLDALDHDGKFDAGLPRDLAEGVTLESLDLVFGDGKDLRVDGVRE